MRRETASHGAEVFRAGNEDEARSRSAASILHRTALHDTTSVKVVRSRSQRVRAHGRPGAPPPSRSTPAPTPAQNPCSPPIHHRVNRARACPIRPGSDGSPGDTEGMRANSSGNKKRGPPANRRASKTSLVCPKTYEAVPMLCRASTIFCADSSMSMTRESMRATK